MNREQEAAASAGAARSAAPAHAHAPRGSAGPARGFGRSAAHPPASERRAARGGRFAPANGTRAPPRDALVVSAAAEASDLGDTENLLETKEGRVLCLGSLSGDFSRVNHLAAKHNAVAALAVGDLGLFDSASIDRISPKVLRYIVETSHLLLPSFQTHLLSLSPEDLKAALKNPEQHLNLARTEMVLPTSAWLRVPNTSVPFFPLSELPLLLSGDLKLDVPTYVVYGACEDGVLVDALLGEAPASSTAPSPASLASLTPPHNLHLLDPSTSHVLQSGGLTIRLLGLPGAVVPSKLFDVGEGVAAAGAKGTMWTTLVEIGKLIDTAARVHDASEVRILVSHAAPRDMVAAQVARAVKADATISSSLHLKYLVSYSDAAVFSDAAYDTKYSKAHDDLSHIIKAAKPQLDSLLVATPALRAYINRALSALLQPAPAPDSVPARALWNWNLSDAHAGYLLLSFANFHISAASFSPGFDFSQRTRHRLPPALSLDPTAKPDTPAVLDAPLPNHARPATDRPQIDRPAPRSPFDFAPKRPAPPKSFDPAHRRPDRSDKKPKPKWERQEPQKSADLPPKHAKAAPKSNDKPSEKPAEKSAEKPLPADKPADSSADKPSDKSLPAGISSLPPRPLTTPEPPKDTPPADSPAKSKSKSSKRSSRSAQKARASHNDKPDSKSDSKPETKPDSKPDSKSDSKPETKPETKPDSKPETKPDSKPDSKPESNHDTNHDTKPPSSSEATPPPAPA